MQKKAEEQRKQQEEDKERNQKVIKLCQKFPNVDTPTALFMLEMCSWNIEGAEQQIRDQLQIQKQSQPQIQLQLVNPGNLQMRDTKDFQADKEGYEIITFLNQRFPPPSGSCLNLYRDQACTQLISYTMLSQKINTLNLSNGMTLYFKAESEPKF